MRHSGDTAGKAARASLPQQPGARVQCWVDAPVPSDMEQAEWEVFVRVQASVRGLSPAQPFVFRVEGRCPKMPWHVVTGVMRRPVNTTGTTDTLPQQRVLFSGDVVYVDRLLGVILVSQTRPGPGSPLSRRSSAWPRSAVCPGTAG